MHEYGCCLHGKRVTFNCQFRPSQCAYDAVAAAAADDGDDDDDDAADDDDDDDDDDDAAAAAADDDDDDDDHIAVNSRMPTFPVVVLRFKKVDSQLAMMGVT